MSLVRTVPNFYPITYGFIHDMGPVEQASKGNFWYLRLFVVMMFMSFLVNSNRHNRLMNNGVSIVFVRNNTIQITLLHQFPLASS